MQTLTWEQFVSNVQGWAQERGIYEHSTPNAQLLKALSELGELADAVIKNDRDGLIDAIGDVAVCMVNYAHMTEVPFEEMDLHDIEQKDIAEIGTNVEVLAIISHNLGQLLSEQVREEPQDELATQILLCLGIVSIMNSLEFMHCCTQAWNSIKERKGRMVAGGAFVKDE